MGLEPIRPRLIKDEEVLRKALSLYGIPKILLRNHVPVSQAKKYFDDYEITPEYLLSWDRKRKKVVIGKKAWSVKDDNQVESYSLLPPPVVVGLIKQLTEIFSR